MSQISPPIRIVLVCAVAFMAAWMLFLRPKDDAGTPAAAVPTAAKPVDAGGADAESAAGKAVEKANELTAAQDKRAEELAGGAGETAAAPAPTTATAPLPATATASTQTGAPAASALPSKQELSRVPADVRRALVKRQILVLGVFSRKGIDDRLVRQQLDKVDKLHGRVFVKAVPVKRVARYGAITRGTDLSQTPTVVVVDFALKATTLAGWVDAATIDQAVVDGMLNSGRVYADPYLRSVAVECRQSFPAFYRLEPASGPEYSRAIGRYGVLITQLKTNIAALSTPAKWRGFRGHVVADMAALAATMTSWHAALGAKPSFATAVTAYKRHSPAARKSFDRLNARFDAHDVLRCGSRS